VLHELLNNRFFFGEDFLGSQCHNCIFPSLILVVYRNFHWQLIFLILMYAKPRT
jgi:hypothetical protein